MAQELALEEELVFLCGHYEGIDERVLETIVTDYVSIGDYVLTGGELPSMVMIDAVSRLVPGVLKNEESAEFESFHNNLLEYPQYTRPEVWQGKTVPDILLSGDHAKVDKWRLLQSEERTRERRPDLYEAYAREGKALSWLLKKKIAHMDMIEVIRRGTGRASVRRRRRRAAQGCAERRLYDVRRGRGYGRKTPFPYSQRIEGRIVCGSSGIPEGEYLQAF